MAAYVNSGGVIMPKNSDPIGQASNRKKRVNIPASVDWRNSGVLTGVKNQGQCGSCWSFSSTGAIESAAVLAGSRLQSLSEQNLVDCVYPTGGCNGGKRNEIFEKFEFKKIILYLI